MNTKMASTKFSKKKPSKMPRSCSLKTTVSQAAFYALIAVIAEQIGRCAPLLVRDSQMRGSFDAWRHRIWALAWATTTQRWIPWYKHEHKLLCAPGAKTKRKLQRGHSLRNARVTRPSHGSRLPSCFRAPGPDCEHLVFGWRGGSQCLDAIWVTAHAQIGSLHAGNFPQGI